MCGISLELYWRTFVDNTKANECMHCKHMGEEIRLHLHISFILVSLFSKVAFEDKRSTTFVSAKLFAICFLRYFRSTRRAVGGLGWWLKPLFPATFSSRDATVAEWRIPLEPGCSVQWVHLSCPFCILLHVTCGWPLVCAPCLVSVAAVHVSHQPQTSRPSRLGSVVAWHFSVPSNQLPFKSKHLWLRKTSPVASFALPISLYYQPVSSGPTDFVHILTYYLLPGHPRGKLSFSSESMQLMSWVQEEGSRSDSTCLWGPCSVRLSALKRRTPTSSQ